MQEQLTTLFRAHFGHNPCEIKALRAHASERRIYRLADRDRTVIGVVNPNVSENRAFVAFSRHFKKHALPVPEIYAVDFSEVAYLEEDLGDATLYDLLISSRSDEDPFPVRVEAIYLKTAQVLPRFQIDAGASLDYTVCHQSPHYDRRSILDDMYYFRDSFLRRSGAAFDAGSLESDFQALADLLAAADSRYFLYRDFQSRNIMVVQGDEPFFIDYQAGRKGALQWDIASLLYQSQARIPPAARDRIFEAYLQSVEQYIPIDRPAFLDCYRTFVCLRLMQVLGTYGKVGLGEGKEYFRKGIPIALANLTDHLNSGRLPLELPVLRQVLSQLRPEVYAI